MPPGPTPPVPVPLPCSAPSCQAVLLYASTESCEKPAWHMMPQSTVLHECEALGRGVVSTAFCIAVLLRWTDGTLTCSISNVNQSLPDPLQDSPNNGSGDMQQHTNWILRIADQVGVPHSLCRNRKWRSRKWGGQVGIQSLG